MVQHVISPYNEIVFRFNKMPDVLCFSNIRIAYRFSRKDSREWKSVAYLYTTNSLFSIDLLIMLFLSVTWRRGETWRGRRVRPLPGSTGSSSWRPPPRRPPMWRRLSSTRPGRNLYQFGQVETFLVRPGLYIFLYGHIVTFFLKKDPVPGRC